MGDFKLNRKIAIIEVSISYQTSELYGYIPPYRPTLAHTGFDEVCTEVFIAINAMHLKERFQSDSLSQ